MTSSLDIDAGLALHHLPPEHRLRPVLKAAFTRVNAGRVAIGTRLGKPCWSDRFFGLDQVDLFQGLRAPGKVRVLQRAADALLEEAYSIEKLGITFAAKMLLLSESTEERMLYALFAADEARHLQAVSAHLDQPETTPPTSPFHTLLADVIIGGDRATLTFVIQVVLEGWGLTHYRHLADGCDHDDLRGVLRGILEDEARHHGSGKVLVEERGLDEQSRLASTEVLADFLQMVRIGPVSLVAILETELGGLSVAQRQEVLLQLEGPRQAEDRLTLLKRLMSMDAAMPVVSALEAQDLFSPATVEQAAAALAAA